MFKYEKLSVLISCMPFLSDAGVGVQVVEHVAATEHDSEEDRFMDPDDSYTLSLHDALPINRKSVV